MLLNLTPVLKNVVACGVLHTEGSPFFGKVCEKEKGRILCSLFSVPFISQLWIYNRGDSQMAA